MGVLEKKGTQAGGHSEASSWEQPNALAYDSLAPYYDQEVLASPFYKNV